MLIEFACDEICYINIIAIVVYPPPKKTKIVPWKEANWKGPPFKNIA